MGTTICPMLTFTTESTECEGAQGNGSALCSVNRLNTSELDDGREEDLPQGDPIQDNPAVVHRHAMA